MALPAQPVYPTITIKLELAGVGAGWTNVSADVRTVVPISLRWGIQGSGPQDRVASTGVFTFALDNSTKNSGAVVGYYSPNHASKRTGFALGIRVLFEVTYSSSSKFLIGTIDDVAIVAGIAGERLSYVTVVDWMDEAARFKLTGLPTLLGTNAKAVIEQALAAVPTQPNAVSIDAGSDTYPYAMANGGKSTEFLSELQRIEMSELGRVFVLGGTSAGAAGTLRAYSRGALVQAPLNVSQFTLDTIAAMDPKSSRKAVRNVFRGTVHPRTVDSLAEDPVVLYTYPGVGTSIDPGQTLKFLGQYSDPQQTAQRVSGYSMIAPVNGLDITLNSNPNSTGTDLYANFTVTAGLGSEGVNFTLTNNGAVTAFLAFLQVRGYGIYDYEPLEVEVRDATSVTANGEHEVALDHWYQKDPTFAKNAADYLIQYYKDPTTNVQTVSFHASVTAALVAQALTREPGDMITVSESVSGINRAFRIQGAALVVTPGGTLDCSWILSPEVDTTDYWVLEEVGSDLGTNTRIAL